MIMQPWHDSWISAHTTRLAEAERYLTAFDTSAVGMRKVRCPQLVNAAFEKSVACPIQ